MANQFYGLNRGDNDQSETVQTGTSTQGTDLEVRIDLTKSFTKAEIEVLLDTIARRIYDRGENELGSI